MLISVALLTFSMASCKKDYLYVEKTVPPPANLSFASNVLPILNSHGCAGPSCHDGGSKPPDLTASNAYTSLIAGSDLSGNLYVNLATPSASVFYQSVNDPNFSWGQMPLIGSLLTANEQALILAWITQGAKP